MHTGSVCHVSDLVRSRVYRRVARTVSVAAWVVLLGIPGLAQSVISYASVDSITIGERFAFVLVVEHSPESTVALPDSVGFGEVTFGDIEALSVVNRGSRPSTTGAGPAMVDSVVFEVATFAIDTALVAPIAIPVVSDGDTTMVASLPFYIPVVSLVPDTAQDVLDIAPLAGFPRALWPWLLGALALILIGLGIYFLMRRKRAPEEVTKRPPRARINPYDAALQKLRSLESAELTLEENVKPFFDDLSEVLRTYLGDTLRMHALEETTRELILELRAKADPPANLIPFDAPNDVRNLLELADLVKFADFYPPAEKAKRAIGSTRETIETIERHLRFRQQPEETVDADRSEIERGHRDGM